MSVISINPCAYPCDMKKATGHLALRYFKKPTTLEQFALEQFTTEQRMELGDVVNDMLGRHDGQEA